MQNLMDELTSILKQKSDLFEEDRLLKNKLIESILKNDQWIVKQLLNHPRLKQHFFADYDDFLVFDAGKFQRFVNNKEFLPDDYTSFGNKIGLAYPDGRYLTSDKSIVLVWPYKDCILEGGLTKEEKSRNEVFWNETLAPDEVDRLLYPKAFTGFCLHSEDGMKKIEAGDVDFSHQNLLIKGNNLLALKSIEKRFSNKIKLIYIDPPYNTGNDEFVYNDTFSEATWLTFMRNRLECGKKLLTEDGAIFVQISDKGVSRLRSFLDEFLDWIILLIKLPLKLVHLLVLKRSI